MRLADFILMNRGPILAEWEAFARTCAPASGGMNVAALRDHADAMLLVIAADLATPQGRFEQSEKSKGRAHVADPPARTAADEHGTGRADSGFTMGQLVAEYRSMRATVIRLWTEFEGTLDATDIEDLTRFNEAIDQALAESVLRFNQEVEQAKETFLAVLGHDLRTPLGAIYTSAQFLLDTADLDEAERAVVARIAASATRSVTMVGDLLDFTRSRLGDGIPVARAALDLGRIVRDVVDEMAAAHPTSAIRVDVHGEPQGEWDAARLRQALGNLILNAVQHGAADGTVTVDIQTRDGEVTVAVHNRGAVISPEQLDGIFNPMKARRPALKTDAAAGPTGSLGLGLYIAERIVNAHDGRIDVASSQEHGTTFSVHLPRKAKAPTA